MRANVTCVGFQGRWTDDYGLLDPPTPGMLHYLSIASLLSLSVCMREAPFEVRGSVVFQRVC